MRVELELRNVPRDRIFEYLAQAGGRPLNDHRYGGQHWCASLQPMEPIGITVFSIPRNLLIIEGDAAEVERVESFMRRKTMRGGG